MTSLLHRRWFRALAWTLVSLVTLYALLCAWMNWTGARMLAATQAKLKAAGETTDFRAVATEPVPDDTNFCAVPALRDLALQIGNDASKGEPGARRERLKKMALPKVSDSKPRHARGAQFGVRQDMTATRDWLRGSTSSDKPAENDAAKEVLAALSAHDALISELAAGLDRPNAQWTPPWRTRELPPMLFAVAMPHYSVTQNAVQTLGVRAAAAARAGDAAKAHESMRIIAKLAEANANDPFLIGLLVSAAQVTELANATWQTCEAQCGSAADFAALETALSTLDFKKAALRAWRGEMSGALDAMRSLKSSGDDGTIASLFVSNTNDASSALATAISHALPGGWLDGNAAVIADHDYDHLLKPLQTAGWVHLADSAAAGEAELRAQRKTLWRHPFHLMASIMAPASTSVVLRVAYAQCLTDQATVACALERHRIEKGAYPETLAPLTLANGKPLPLDALSEKPMGYRKTADGKYALWCIGFDGKDDGGKRVLDVKNPQNTKFSERSYKGDWVWDFAGGK